MGTPRSALSNRAAIADAWHRGPNGWPCPGGVAPPRLTDGSSATEERRKQIFRPTDLADASQPSANRYDGLEDYGWDAKALPESRAAIRYPSPNGSSLLKATASFRRASHLFPLVHVRASQSNIACSRPSSGHYLGPYPRCRYVECGP